MKSDKNHKKGEVIRSFTEKINVEDSTRARRRAGTRSGVVSERHGARTLCQTQKVSHNQRELCALMKRERRADGVGGGDRDRVGPL